MASPQDITRTRLYLGEVIPEGGGEEDTMFTDEQIGLFLTSTRGNIHRAAYEGWLAKAASYANFINISEGNATREMSDLHKHAMTMVKYYERSSSDVTSGRTRVGRIRRSNG